MRAIYILLFALLPGPVTAADKGMDAAGALESVPKVYEGTQ